MKETFDIEEFKHRTSWNLSVEHLDAVIRMYDNCNLDFLDFCAVWVDTNGSLLNGAIDAIVGMNYDMEIVVKSHEKQLAKYKNKEKTMLISILTENPDSSAVYNSMEMEQIIYIKAANNLPFTDYDLQFLEEHLR